MSSDDLNAHIALELQPEPDQLILVSTVGGKRTVFIVDSVLTLTGAAHALRRIARGYEAADQTLIKLMLSPGSPGSHSGDDFDHGFNTACDE